MVAGLASILQWHPVPGDATGAAPFREVTVMITLRNLLVATDFDDASTTALAYGREMARRFSATLHVLHVVNDVGAMVVTTSGLPYDVSRMQLDLEQAERQRLEALVTEEDRRELGPTVVQVISPAPAHAIVAYAEDAHVDLIVMGTHGRGTMAHVFMGSVAERVVRTAPCPVLTVRHPEHEFIVPDALQTVAPIANEARA